MKAICPRRRNRPSFWTSSSSRLTYFLMCEFWMILFKARAIFASRISKCVILAPQTDREVFNSSSESITSTLWSKTSDAKLGTKSHFNFWSYFQDKYGCGSEHLSNCSSDVYSLCCPSIKILLKSQKKNEFMVDGLLFKYRHEFFESIRHLQRKKSLSLLHMDLVLSLSKF